MIALLVNPDASSVERDIKEVEEAARQKGLQLHVLRAADSSAVDAAFGTLDQLRPDVLVVAGDSFFTARRGQLVALAALRAIPAIYDVHEFAAAGGLVSYGASMPAAYRGAGLYASRILQGAKPADLPVQQPTKFELVINLKTAKALGLTVPPSLLARADEVIE